MVKCTKCGRPLTDNDIINWKCPTCEKMFNVNLSKLKNLYKQKQIHNNRGALLKCPGCGVLLDNGNEMLANKCVECGNVTKGNLEYFTTENENSLEAATFYKEKIFCKHCGKELKEDLNFCPNCGKPCATEKVVHFCSGCGEKIENDVKFCPKCGTKIVPKIDINISDLKSGMGKITCRFSVKRVGILLSALVIVAIMAVVGIKAIPKIFVSPETLLLEGNYEKAYEKSKKDEKEHVLIENLISSICREAEDGLKDPTSFKLRNAWYETTGRKRIVLYISGKNSMGGTNSSYWLYTFDSDDNKYELFTVINDMDDEEYKSYDDSEDKLEKLLNNAAREVIRNIYIDDNKLDQDLIERINALHSNDLLKNVKLLEEVVNIYPSDDIDEV